jgi:hypothetical protein
MLMSLVKSLRVGARSRPRIHIYIQFGAKITKKILFGIFRINLGSKEIKAVLLLTLSSRNATHPKGYKFLVRKG